MSGHVTIGSAFFIRSNMNFGTLAKGLVLLNFSCSCPEGIVEIPYTPVVYIKPTGSVVTVELAIKCQQGVGVYFCWCGSVFSRSLKCINILKSYNLAWGSYNTNSLNVINFWIYWQNFCRHVFLNQSCTKRNGLRFKEAHAQYFFTRMRCVCWTPPPPIPHIRAYVLCPALQQYFSGVGGRCRRLKSRLPPPHGILINAFGIPAMAALVVFRLWKLFYLRSATRKSGVFSIPLSIFKLCLFKKTPILHLFSLFI